MYSVVTELWNMHVNCGITEAELIEDLRKSRGLHSVRAFGHGPVYIYIYRSLPAGVAQSRHAFVGATVSTWAR